MYTFSFNANKQAMQRACEEFENIERVEHNDCKATWTLENKYATQKCVIIDLYADGTYFCKCADGMFTCYFRNSKITITDGEYMGRKCKAESRLKVFTQAAMRIYALEKCGYLKV